MKGVIDEDYFSFLIYFRTNYVDAGVERIVDQVVNPKVKSHIEPEVEGVIYDYLGVEKPSEKGALITRYFRGTTFFRNEVFIVFQTWRTATRPSPARPRATGRQKRCLKSCRTSLLKISRCVLPVIFVF